MKNIKSLIALLVMIAISPVFYSCGDDEPEYESDLVNYLGGTSPYITIQKYEDVSLSEAVCFSATGNWTAEIYPANSSFEIQPVTGNKSRGHSYVSWLAINPSSGEAANWKASLILAPNHTTEKRYAVIRIMSAKNSIDFYVTQGCLPSGGGSGIIPPVEN